MNDGRNPYGLYDSPKPFNREERITTEEDLKNMALKEEIGFSLTFEEAYDQGFLFINEDLRDSDTKILY